MLGGGGGGRLTSGQKGFLALAAILVGPSVLKKAFDKPKEAVDLSSYNIITHYETPAIERMDSTLRIEFCQSWQTGGQFRRCAQELQKTFPGLKIEGGAYTPPVQVQYGIRAVRAAQVGAAAFFFFGEQIFGLLARRPPKIHAQMQENKLLTFGAIYGLDVIAQTMKSINAFEITYNGHLLHSKLKTSAFPQPYELSTKLRGVMQREKKQVVQEEDAQPVD